MSSQKPIVVLIGTTFFDDLTKFEVTAIANTDRFNQKKAPRNCIASITEVKESLLCPSGTTQ
jgi:rRNA-processing protein FCF1